VSQPVPSRYHALDSLRASMMFLGIVLHAMVAYSPSSPWLIRPLQTTRFFDPAIVFIHAFRMPVFYAMAGLLTALLLEHYGWRRAILNRFWRIAVPFIIGCLLVVPLMFFLAAFAKTGTAEGAWLYLMSGRFLSQAHPIHLWFLEYLLLLYAVAAVLLALTSLLPEKVRSAGLALFRSGLQAVWAPLPMAGLTFLTLLPMRWPGLQDPPSFAPTPHILLAYAVPFFFGWLLYHARDLLEVLNRRAWFYGLLGLVLCVAYVALLFLLPRGAGFYGLRAVLALAMWCLIFGITGLFLRYFSGHSPLWRYLCDSSYFIYLAHLPVILLLQLVTFNVPLPAVVMAPIVLIVTTIVLLPIYTYAVRPTFVGALLNGRRYPSAIVPAAVAAT
jgi:glucans biosynthesis protein C